MRKYMFLIMAIFSVNVFAGVITEKELNSDESFEYIYRVNKHDIFKCKNGDCDLIYNNSNNYSNASDDALAKVLFNSNRLRRNIRSLSEGGLIGFGF